MKMRRYNLSLYIAGGIVLVITSLILKPFALVGAGERGVIMRFGTRSTREIDNYSKLSIPQLRSH
ncbi:MAG: hypothetical protein P2A85_01335 [Microcoleus anatoxicus]|uniref:hypothetical protein n=1 Tax=Microcoleus anatoxicus TaxID=2705319 RepID=UPI00367058DD